MRMKAVSLLDEKRLSCAPSYGTDAPHEHVLCLVNAATRPRIV